MEVVKRKKERQIDRWMDRKRGERMKGKGRGSACKREGVCEREGVRVTAEEKERDRKKEGEKKLQKTNKCIHEIWNLRVLVHRVSTID